MISNETKAKIEDAADIFKFKTIGVEMTVQKANERELAMKSFIRGAHWAYANPIHNEEHTVISTRFAVMALQIKEREDKIQKLEADLEMAKEVIELQSKAIANAYILNWREDALKILVYDCEEKAKVFLNRNKGE